MGSVESERFCTIRIPRGISVIDVLSGLLEDTGKELANGESTVECLQKVGPDRFDIILRTKEIRDDLVERGKVKVGKEMIPIEQRVERTRGGQGQVQAEAPTWLSLKGISPYMENEEIANYLSDFGVVQYIERHRYRDGETTLPVFSGDYRVRMIMNKPVPNFVMFGRQRVYVYYRGVIPLCRACELPGHLAWECPTEPCDKCKSRLHETEMCKGRRWERRPTVQVAEEEGNTMVRSPAAVVDDGADQIIAGLPIQDFPAVKTPVRRIAGVAKPSPTKLRNPRIPSDNTLVLRPSSPSGSEGEGVNTDSSGGSFRTVADLETSSSPGREEEPSGKARLNIFEESGQLDDDSFIGDGCNLVSLQTRNPLV